MREPLRPSEEATHPHPLQENWEQLVLLYEPQCARPQLPPRRSQDEGTGNCRAMGTGRAWRKLVVWAQPALQKMGHPVTRSTFTHHPPPLPSLNLTHKPGWFWLPILCRCKGGGACKPERHTCLFGENRSLIRHLQQSLHTPVYTQTFQFPHLISEHTESQGMSTQPHTWALFSPPLLSWGSASSGSLASALQFPRSLCL